MSSAERLVLCIAIAILAVKPSRTRPPRMHRAIPAGFLFPVEDLTGSEESARYAERSSRRRLPPQQHGGPRAPDPARRTAGLRRRSRRSPAGTASDGASAVRIARAADAEMALTAICYLEDGSSSWTSRRIDARNGRLVAGSFSVTRAGLTIYNRIDDAVRRISPQLELFLDPETGASRERRRSFSKRSSLRPTRVWKSSSPLRLRRHHRRRRARAPLHPLPGRNEDPIEKRKEGYHSEEEVLTLSEPLGRIRPRPIMKKPEWAATFEWTTGQFLGAGLGVRYYLFPIISSSPGWNYSTFSGRRPRKRRPSCTTTCGSQSASTCSSRTSPGSVSAPAEDWVRSSPGYRWTRRPGSSIST